jgi:hypothetical protein
MNANEIDGPCPACDARAGHDPTARECVVVGVPVGALHDGPCPACRAMSALVDLDPDFGSREDGRPSVNPHMIVFLNEDES